MKMVLTAAAAFGLAAALTVPALAQQADEHAAAGYGGDCAFSQTMLQAQADSEQQRMAETKAKVDALIDQALAAPQPQTVAQSPVKLNKATPDS